VGHVKYESWIRSDCTSTVFGNGLD